MISTRAEMMHHLYGLEDHFWKQIIDGEVHQWGHLVFDQGLHKGLKEPGFYQGIKNGFNWCCYNIGKPLDISFYQKLHKITCLHFQGMENNTMMPRSKTGIFFQPNCSLSSFENLFATSGGDVRKKIKVIKIIRQNSAQPDKISDKAICFFNNTISRELPERLNNLNAILEKEGLRLKLKKPLAVASIILSPTNESLIKLDYTCLSSKKLTKTVQKIFHRFQTSIYRAEDANAKLEAIAKLFQTLEWLHPFRDGQGRTDLLLLGKLLSEYGFHPAILEFPYVSSFIPLNEWVDYLKKGLLAWEKELLRDLEM